MPLRKLLVPGCLEPENGRRAAGRMLLGNVITLLLCLCLQLIILCMRGPSCNVWPIYVGTIAILLSISILALWKVCYSKWQAWIKVYAWAAQIGILVMVAADYLSGGREFPWILFLLPVGLLSIGVSLGWRAIIPYAITGIGILILAGIAFEKMDNAVAAIMILIVVALPVIEISEIKRDLGLLREAIKVVVNGKRENN